MRAIIGLDPSNPRGSRVVQAGFALSLLGFNFNAGATLGQTFYAPYTISANGAAVTLAMPSLTPSTDVVAPKGATHYELLYGVVSVNFVNMTYSQATVGASLGIRPLTGAAQNNVSLVATLPTAPSADDVVIGVVGMNFYQQLNGQYYPLNNNGTNPLSIEYVTGSGTGAGGGGAIAYDTTLAGPDGEGQGVSLASDPDTSLGFDALSAGSSGPANMVISVGGTEVASVAYLDRYNGRAFTFTEAGGLAHSGVFGPTANF